MTVLDHRSPAGVPHPGRLIALLLAGMLFAAGWLTAKTVLAVTWSITAVRLGWDDAHRTHRRAGGT